MSKYKVRTEWDVEASSAEDAARQAIEWAKRGMTLLISTPGHRSIVISTEDIAEH